MSDQLSKDIAESIEKDLPAHVGNHLLSRLKQADADVATETTEG